MYQSVLGATLTIMTRADLRYKNIDNIDLYLNVIWNNLTKCWYRSHFVTFCEGQFSVELLIYTYV